MRRSGKWQPTQEVRLNRQLAAAAVGIVLGTAACSDSLTFQIAALEVAPSSAQAGDSVAFEFILTVIPSRTVDLTAFIDGEIHQTQTITGAFNGPFEWTLDDAADLIDQYGTGLHTGQVRAVVREDNRSLETSPVSFELVAAAPSRAARTAQLPKIIAQ
jgi:hypothetical protein